jgi:hypothetical protein
MSTTNTLKIHSQTMSARMNNTLNEQMIEAYLREAIDEVKAKSKEKKLSFVIKATCEIKQDETIDFETWSEVSSTDKDTTEKVGETFDLRQTTMDFE